MEDYGIVYTAAPTSQIGYLEHQKQVKKTKEIIERQVQTGFLEHQKQVKMAKEILEKEFEKTEDGKFKCPYCDHVTKYRWNLKKHILVHTGERPYRCEICGLEFKQKEHRKKHMQNLHTEMEQSFFPKNWTEKN